MIMLILYTVGVPTVYSDPYTVGSVPTVYRVGFYCVGALLYVINLTYISLQSNLSKDQRPLQRPN